jgi:hypothetical protein
MDFEEYAIRRQVLRFSTLILSIIITATASILNSLYHKTPEPYHTSLLTGEGWVLELLTGHPERIRCELGMHREVFGALIEELREIGHTNSRIVSLEEQVAIFLHICITGVAIRHAGERFQRSNDTMSRYATVSWILFLVYVIFYCSFRYFRKIVTIFSSPPFYTAHVRQPVASDPIPPQIRGNSKFFPFFKDAVGAIDGSHIHSSPPASMREACRNRKGFISQNCLFACDFGLQFVYALTGWEGSATDARVYEDATDFHIPAGKYYLADAGYPLCNNLLVPYRGVRYHLAEWGRAGVR